MPRSFFLSSSPSEVGVQVKIFLAAKVTMTNQAGTALLCSFSSTISVVCCFPLTVFELEGQQSGLLVITTVRVAPNVLRVLLCTHTLTWSDKE